MKPTILLPALALSLLAAAPLAAQITLPPPEPIETIAPNIYKIFGGGGNTLVVVHKDGVILVDTKMPGNGQAILDEVKKVTDKPVVAIINTHSHPDHVGSTDFIREKYPNVRVISSEATKAEVAGNPMYKPGNVPTETFKDRMTIGSGDERVELYSLGQAHTGGDTFVVIPAARLLFMGDVMAWNMAPFLPSGGIVPLTNVIDELANTLKDVDIVVEGHGYVGSWADFQRFARFNRALLSAARAAYDRGDAPGAAIAELQKTAEFAPLLDTRIKDGLPYGNTPLARAHMNVNVAYQEFSGERVTTANGAPLPATDKHKASNPADTAPPVAGAPVAPRPPLPTR